MTITPILASDVSPVIVPIFLAPIFVALLTLRVIARTSRGTAKGTWAGLIVRLVPILFGGFLLFFLLTVRGGAPSFFIAAAALPFVLGLLSLYAWGRKSPEAARLVKIASRILLYGAFAVCLICLCLMLSKNR